MTVMRSMRQTVMAGPALIEERESTCVLGLRDRLHVDARMNLVITIGQGA